MVPDETVVVMVVMVVMVVTVAAAVADKKSVQVKEIQPRQAACSCPS